MEQQTAEEWFDEQLQDKMFIAYGYFDGVREILIPLDEYMKFKKQAKQMEKEQITNTYLNACARVTPYGYYNDSAEQYYNETYGTK